MTHLLQIGYWRSSDEPHWPDPGAFVDDAWPAYLRATVVEYLRDAQPLEFGCGSSWCRFWCKGLSAHSLGSAQLSDGRFVWPAGLAHYVEHHLVRLPELFLQSIASPPAPLPSPLEIPACYDDRWWRAQLGFGSSRYAFSDPAPLGALFALPTGVPPSPQLLSELRRCPELRDHSIREITAALQETHPFPLVVDIYEPDVLDIRQPLKDSGLTTNFVRYT